MSNIQNELNDEVHLIVASNRGPVSWSPDGDGGWKATRGAGGLVVAIGGAMMQQPGTWVSVALDESDRAVAAEHPDGPFTARTDHGDLQVQLVDVGERFDGYYRQVANRLLWFTLHDMWDEAATPVPAPTEADIEDYLAVNDMIADAVIAEAGRVEGPVEVHLQDYHLLTAAARIREALDDVPLMLYVHTPWTPADAFERVPPRLRARIVEGLQACDVIGVSHEAWAQNLRDGLLSGHAGGTEARDFVLGVDPERLEQIAAGDGARTASQELEDQLGGRRLIARADRSDLSKNIIRGIEAFGELLRRRPELVDQVHFRMLVNPSRQGVPAYRDYLERCEAATRRIQDEHGEDVIELDVGQSFDRVLAVLQRYDVLLTNPIIDGTNLVAKEGPALNRHDGVLVLSRLAGAANVMTDALQIDPFDVAATADALEEALDMPDAERTRRHRAMQAAAVRGQPAEWFAEQRAALARSRDVGDS